MVMPNKINLACSSMEKFRELRFAKYVASYIANFLTVESVTCTQQRSLAPEGARTAPARGALSTRSKVPVWAMHKLGRQADFVPR